MPKRSALRLLRTTAAIIVVLSSSGHAGATGPGKVCQIMAAPDKMATHVSLVAGSAETKCDIQSMVEDLREQPQLAKNEYETSAAFAARASKTIKALSTQYPVNIFYDYAVVLPVNKYALTYNADKQEFLDSTPFPPTARYALFDELLNLKIESSGNYTDGGTLFYAETDRQTKNSVYSGETVFGAKTDIDKEEGTIWGVRIDTPWERDSLARISEAPPAVLHVPQSQAREAASGIYLVLIGKSGFSPITKTSGYHKPTLTDPYENLFDIYLLSFVASDVWIVRGDTGEVLAKYLLPQPADHGGRTPRMRPRKPGN